MAPRPPMGRSSSRFPVAAGDRLSSLPDDLLHAIMSFLPVRQAVQTCVLSRRWEHLWCSMPCLNIDQLEFNSTASGARGGSQFEEFEPEFISTASGARGGSQFEEFVNNLLMFHSASSLDMFRFRFTCGYQLFKVVERWIRRAMKCCPAVMEIYSSSGLFHRFPHLGSSACRLKKLHLVAISLDESFTQQLPSGCPVLEDLELNECHLHSPEIKSYTLKNLIITGCRTYSGRVLTITAPALVSFYLVFTVVVWNSDGVLVNEMPALVKAKVCLESSSPEGPCKLLCSLTNVRNLELSGLETLVCFFCYSYGIILIVSIILLYC
ncbi:MEIOTIC F-BOX protein MOF [Setaria viridis]|uniref:MEIOTIC F-BOX protein MOF n=1 Tax=Setaria viridis TaxID=4556 RepID=UPI003B3B6B8C